MPEHMVRVSQPSRELVNSDVTFEIYSDGQKLGTMLVSKGTVDWFPRNAQTSISLQWEEFADVLDAAFNDRQTLLKTARSITSP
jgi:hypothetical protein